MSGAAADSPFTRPDFAYPKQVSETWKKELDKGLANKDNPLILRALLNIWLATSEISEKNQAEFLNTLADLSQKNSKDAELQALLDLMQADIYSDIYNERRWTYDKRQLPLTPLPADYNEWSGEQFRNKISSLLESSLSHAEALSKVKLDKYNGVITPSHYPSLYPTLLDFVAYKVIEFDRENNTGLKSAHDIKKQAFDALLKYHPADSAPHFMAYLLSDATAPESRFDLYQENKDKWYSGLALLLTLREDKRARYFAMKDYLQTHPQSPIKKCISYEMEVLMDGNVIYSFADKVAKGMPLKVNLDIRNLTKIRVGLYTLKEISTQNGKKQVPDRLISDTIVKTDIEGPFSVSKSVEFTVPEYGQYTVAAFSASGTMPDPNGYYKTVICSDLMLMSASAQVNKQVLYSAFVADLTTGRPVENVMVWGDTIWNNQSRKTIVNTDAEGKADVHTYTYICAAKGDDRWAAPLRVNGTTYIPQSQILSTITTSLPIYHFGDEMEWFGVLFERNPKTGNHPVTNKVVDIVLLNSNYKEIETLTCTTDQWGRVSGKFKLPANGLAGNFIVRITEHNQKKTFGSTSFTVSDYKLPTFTVNVNSIQRNYPETDAVTLSGIAQTYANFPVADAKVKINAAITTGWRWWNATREDLTNIETVTDNAGNFTVTLPAELLRAYAGNRAVYVTATVTSQGGETRSASATFVLGKPYYISADIAENIDNSNPVNLNIGFLTPTFDKANFTIAIKLYNSEEKAETANTYEDVVDDEDISEQPVSENRKPAYTFTLASSAMPVDLSKVKSGMYDFEIAPVDTTLAEPLMIKNRFVYNKNQHDFPLDKMVWTPYSDDQNIRFNGQSGQIIVGTARKNLTLLCVISNNDSLISTRWITFKKGMNHIDITLPDGVTNAYVTLAGANNGDIFNHTYNIVTPGNTRKLDFKIESFRNKVAPLSTETWKFRTNMINGTDTAGTQAAVMLRLFSQAINDLTPIKNLYFFNQWNVRLTRFFSFANSISYGHWNNRSVTASTVSPFDSYPSFELYGRNWNGEHIMYAKNMLYASRSTATAIGSTNFDAGTDDLNVVREYKEEVVVAESEEAAVEEVNKQAETQYRPSEVPLALFEPMLVTNPDGTLEYSVTFPDASTTWLLNATAYTSNIYFANIEEKIVAAHPLMVQTSLPRFMRLGDKATLAATVMNNSGEALPAVATRFEAINPATGSVIAFAEEQLSLDNGQMKVVTMELLADRLSPGLLIRAKVSGGNYTDGEQSMIAILESSQPVVETTPFFLNPDQKTVSLDVDPGADASVTLEFYQNPAWSVVTALPGLRPAAYKTAIDAAAAICSAAIAEKLLNRTPAIGTAIRQWLGSDRADSTLVSMLQRNPDLKIALLEATPWMNDAMNDTQRMQRLALLFDRKEIKNVYSSAIHELAKLQRSKGWAWTSDNEKPSYWATLQALEIFGYLKSLDCLPDDKQLATMIRNAVEYVDAEAVQSTRLKNGKVASDISYTLVRTPFTDIRQSSAARRITEVTIQKIVASWKTYTLRNKAFAAIILAQNNYISTARAIVASISEFSIESPDKGLSWDKAGIGTTARILQAYSLTGQPRAQIDAIRQWLIIQKAATNWGTSCDATCVIYNILATGSEWTPLSPGSTVVTVNNNEFTPDKVDNITGYFRADLTEAVDGKRSTVTVTRTGATPAYGSIYSIGTQRMDTISAAGCPELTVTKRFLVKETTPEATTWKEATSFRVGDIVKVSLTVKVTATMQYVVISDNRPACIEPVNQLPARVWSEGIMFYRQTGDSSSDIFISYLPEGTYILEQEFTVTHPGEFTSGIATAQSQYAPQYTAHSAGFILKTAK